MSLKVKTMAKKNKKNTVITLDFTEAYNRYFEEFGSENIAGTMTLPKKESMWKRFKNKIKSMFGK